MPLMLRATLRAARPTATAALTALTTSVRHSHTSHDIVIVGGGPAGLTLATALKASSTTQNLDIALVEGSDLGRVAQWQLSADRFENRVSSLTPRSVKFLERIGAWTHIQSDRVKPYDHMVAWDGVSGSRVEFDPSILGQHPEIAYMVENFNLQCALLARLAELGGTSIMDKARVSSITIDNDESGYPVVQLESGATLKTRLLIGCDGANSPVRTFSGIEARGWDYGRHGLVAAVKLETEPVHSTAYQRFLVSGPIALLPMVSGYATLVWSTTPERAAFLKALEPADFCAMVNAGFRLNSADLDYLHSLDPTSIAPGTIVDEVAWRLSNTQDDSLPRIAVVQDQSRASFPLRMRHADRYVGERVALVGDAAHTTHPLAGQGLNMGQSDVAYLSEALEKAVARGLDIGSSLALEPYWRNAYLPNHVMLGVVDKLHKLYSTDFGPVVQARSLGLDLVNRLGFVKSVLMKGAWVGIYIDSM